MAELFALGHLVLLLGLDQLRGMTCSYRKGSERGVWETGIRKLRAICVENCAGKPLFYTFTRVGPSSIYTPFCSLSLGASSMWDSNGDQTYPSETNFSIIIAKEKQGDVLLRELQCLVR